MTEAEPRRHPIWLVRHASTSWTGIRWCGRADPPLDPRGRVEAKALAARLVPDLPPATVILASRARRAIATARAVAEPGRLPIELDDDLLEVDVGRAEGLIWDELAAREPGLAAAIAAAGRVDWPGGETAADVDARAARAAERIRIAAVGAPVVVVSHGALLHAIARALGVEPLPPPLEPAGLVRVTP